KMQSLFLHYEQQLQFPISRRGKVIPAITLASGLPYHSSELHDRTGSFLRTSFTGGNVLFDFFHKDKLRRFYNAVVVGNMGAGKSTALKKLLMDNEERENYIRGFNVTEEYKKMDHTLGSQTVRLNE